MNTTITVIIADDHAVYLEGLHVVLNGVPNIKIIAEAMNGEDLIKKVAKLQPDIVLTDITMPVIDGISATKEITKKYPAVGVIALSVSNEDSAIIDMLEAGASGYLLKNSDKHEIIEAINIVHNRGTYYCRNTSNQITKLIKNRFNSNQGKKQPVLSDQELQIIRLICEEKTSKEIAQVVHLSDRTVESWRSRIQEKLDVRSTAGIVIYAIRNGIYKMENKTK